MAITLTEAEQAQLKKFEKGNRYLFLTGTMMLLFVVGAWALLAANPKSTAQLAEQLWPNAQQVTARLSRIVPQTEMERYLLTRLQEILPLGPAMVKVMAVRSILSWLFCIGILSMGFSSRQKRMIEFFKDLISRG